MQRELISFAGVKTFNSQASYKTTYAILLEFSSFALIL